MIVLLARQRSGTNSLRHVLNAHPDIACLPEVFHPTPAPADRLAPRTNYFNFLEQHPRYTIRDVLTSREAQRKVFLDYVAYLRRFSDQQFLLIDVKYNSTHHMDGPWRPISAEPTLFSFIRQYKLRVLNLRRRNYLRYYLSRVKASQTRKWTVRERSGGSQEPPPVTDFSVVLPMDELMPLLKLCRAEDELVDHSFAHYRPYLAVEYEDLFPRLGAPASEVQLERLTDWLDIDWAFPSTRPQYRKQAHLPLRDTIDNYEEVEEALRGTEFEYCLEDERMYRSQPSPAAPT